MATARADPLARYNAKRDFTKTAEPPGESAKPGSHIFMVQKHDATRLHWDLRLEMDGVLKSWAVTRGPSLDPDDKRLAVRTEDHPLSYATFEGTIPKGEYGGGTVMLWDRGTYTYAGDDDVDPEEGLRRGYAKGDLKFELRGKRLRGTWVLVRMRSDEPGKPQWLLIKHRDEFAREDSDVVAENLASVASRRTMEQIAQGRSRTWQSNR